MIELNDDWVKCYDINRNPAYFPYNNIHPDYEQENYVLVTAQEFMEYYDLIDGTFDYSYDETYTHFKHKHAGKEVEFEDIHFSKDELMDMVTNALVNDVDRCQVFRRPYEDWDFIVSLDNTMDSYFICDFTVDQILYELGIPSVYDLQVNHETSDLQIDDNDIPSMKK